MPALRAYVYLENIPVRQTKHGEVLNIDLEVIEREIASEIVGQGIPTRGEVHGPQGKGRESGTSHAPCSLNAAPGNRMTIELP